MIILRFERLFLKSVIRNKAIYLYNEAFKFGLERFPQYLRHNLSRKTMLVCQNPSRTVHFTMRNRDTLGSVLLLIQGTCDVFRVSSGDEIDVAFFRIWCNKIKTTLN